MTAIQKWGVAVAAVAIGTWIVFAIAVVSTAPEDGANIGAGLLGMLGIALSIAAAVVLVVGTRSTSARAGGAVCIALLAVFWLVAPDDGVADGVKIGMLVAAVAGLAASAGTVALERRQQP
ncbi:hypothetical protein ACI79C_07620 [Geodermatophilus sp. SYSU D00697]